MQPKAKVVKISTKCVSKGTALEDLKGIERRRLTANRITRTGNHDNKANSANTRKDANTIALVFDAICDKRHAQDTNYSAGIRWNSMIYIISVRKTKHNSI